MKPVAIQVKKVTPFSMRGKNNPSANVMRVTSDGVHLADFSGPQSCIDSAVASLKSGGSIDENFEQRHQCEVVLPDGRSPSL